MIKFKADIDIDVPTDFKPVGIFPVTRASLVDQQEIKPHVCGVYFQNIPRDTISDLASIPYDQAEELGYTKIDFLHLSLLDNIKTREELKQLSNSPVDWSLLEDPNIVEKLFQIHRQFNLVQKLKPKSLNDLADLLALMRPGKKKYLEQYINNKQLIRPKLYTKEPTTGYTYKKSHAIAYAKWIIIQLNIIKREQIL